MKNWYKKSQVVNLDMLSNSIYQRLMQASDGISGDSQSTADDILSQGYSPQQIEQCIQYAVSRLLGYNGNEQMLNPSQQNILATIRGNEQMLSGENFDMG